MGTMNITYFNRALDAGISIRQGFEPLIKKIGETNHVESYDLPESRFTPKCILKNLWFTYKHRNKHGINHLTGGCHYILLALLGCKTVLTVHDLGFYNHKMNPIKHFIFYYFQIYLPIKLATKVIAITEKTKSEINSIVPFHREILVARHHSVDQFTYFPKEIDKKHLKLLAIGTEPHKNLETVIRAAAKILNSSLVVFKKMTDEQKDMCEKLGVSYQNKYNVPRQEVLDAYREADIVCFPSSYEGFGAITVEGQRTGRPVITTNREPMKSVAGGGAILLNNPKDDKELLAAINKILEDKEFRKSLIERGYKNSLLYSLDNCAKEHIEIYKSIK